MKKILMLPGFIMLSFLVGLSTEAISEECYENINLQTINSNNLLNYIQSNSFQVSEICTEDLCNTLKSINITKAVEKFNEDYYEHLQKIVDEETYLALYLKGFKIESIRVNKCFNQ